ncbi:hypothetical protein GCM10025768_27640 [Microbacterium pseudoresistens]|uniref:Uncharacterized protein n=1 Tax=Microbacterium pseudoresistens TaxID=640634 RepID=A0A7Y9EVG4_9MICO|nr:hypothetical protein [Microbacterium pseudoresistens]NYD54703.1 hypothetical protein [Microbacterium pseudoresistens]
MRNHDNAVVAETQADLNELHPLIHIDPDLHVPLGRESGAGRYLRALRNLFPQTP